MLGAVWLAAVVFGMHWLLSYKGTPGGAGRQHVSWPRETRLLLDSTRPNLVIFAHPRCPCSRATVAELESIISQSEKPFSTQVVFYRPKTETDAWAFTDLYRKAQSLPGVRVLVDREGEEASRFGAETSGHALLFNGSGELLFSGGITGSRGHAGENAGTASVLQALNGARVFYAKTSVFGCPLGDDSLSEPRP